MRLFTAAASPDLTALWMETGGATTGGGVAGGGVSLRAPVVLPVCVNETIKLSLSFCFHFQCDFNFSHSSCLF